MKNKKWIFLVIAGLIVILIMALVLNNNKIIKKTLNIKDSRGLYLIDIGRSIYSDIENPKMILNGKTVLVKEIKNTNCTASCIHNYSEPIETLWDGGSKIYEYEVESEKYYVIECNKINSKNNNGKDVIISKDKDKLSNLC